MAKDASVAPKERVNITYTPADADGQQEVELPLKILSIGDYTGREDERSVEERKPVNIDKDNFNQVLAEHGLGLDFAVDNLLAGDEQSELSVHLEFTSIRDFEPEGVVAQVPQLQKLLDLRHALTALKGPLGNVPAFRKKLQSLLADEAARDALLKELHIDTSDANTRDKDSA